MSESQRTVFIDCSATYYLGINTGIQRVVRNLIKRAPEAAAAQDLRCIPVVARFGHFWQSDQFARLQPNTAATSNLLSRGSGLAAWLGELEKKAFAAGEKVAPYKLLAYSAMFARKLVRFVGYRLLQLPFIKGLLTGRIRRIRPAAGDILILPDAFWAYDVITPLHKPRYATLHTIPMIHDLIPLTHPQYCAADFAAAFDRLLPQICHHASAIIGISQATLDALNDYFDASGMQRERNLPKAVSYSGADLINEPGHALDTLPLRDDIRTRFNRHNSFLMVGTIEPRKGYDLVFETFSKLWEAGFEKQLVIVGRIGWMCEELLSRMQTSPWLDRYLHLYHDANDHELHHLYGNTSALIFASRVEGFGLPFVEAMQQGLAVIASDIPVFREIGGSYPMYFASDSQDDLAATIHAFRKPPDRMQTPKAVRWKTWDESTAELLRIAVLLADPQSNENAQADRP